MSPMLAVSGLGKRYTLGESNGGLSTLREAIVDALQAPFRRTTRPADTTLWALREVSFEVQPGEVVGVIGRNGAGKSTLLKILARITTPTEGSARLYGRVGSLLEVGTGFHSELSGRENIYLNGAILGMKRRDIARRFEEIVAFAEVERFLDTPVKRYSSGMYMRLAFAVAAHLEPEVLVVDEVLAVGDAAFQRKCLGKMGEVARAGRTVLFVSHNMAAIRHLCSRTLVLQAGRIVWDGAVAAGVERYLAEQTGAQSAEVELAGVARPAIADTTLRIERACLHTADQRPRLKAGAPIELDLQFSVQEPLTEVVLGVTVHNSEGVCLLDCRSSHCLGTIAQLEPGGYRTRCRMEPNLLPPGFYSLSVGARCASKYLDYLPHAMSFEVYSDALPGSLWLDESVAVLRLESWWSVPEPEHTT